MLRSHRIYTFDATVIQNGRRSLMNIPCEVSYHRFQLYVWDSYNTSDMLISSSSDLNVWGLCRVSFIHSSLKNCLKTIIYSPQLPHIFEIKFKLFVAQSIAPSRFYGEPGLHLRHDNTVCSHCQWKSFRRWKGSVVWQGTSCGLLTFCFRGWSNLDSWGWFLKKPKLEIHLLTFSHRTMKSL